MGKLSDLRQVLGDSADHVERLAKGMTAVDEAARSLNSISVAKQGSTDQQGNTVGASGPNSSGHTTLGNTVGTGDGTAQSGIAGTAGSGSKSNGGIRTVAYAGPDGKPARRRGGIVLGVFDESGNFIPGFPDPPSGPLRTVVDANGNDILHPSGQVASERGSNIGVGAPGGGAGRTSDFGGIPLGPGQSLARPPSTGTDPNIGSIAASSISIARSMERLLAQATKNESSGQLRALGLLG
jgi:hypothetical protein